MKISHKIFISIVTLLLCCNTLSAQYTGRASRRITADIRFGLNMSQMDIKDGNEYKKLKIGFQMGGLINMKVLGDFQFQTGFLVTKKGLKKEQYTYAEDVVTGIASITDKLTIIDTKYIQIPFNIGYERYLTPDFALNINVGPYVAHGINSNRRIEGTITQVPINQVIEILDTGNQQTFKKNSLKRLDYGIGANVGLVYDIYTLSLGYDHGLANVSDQNKEEMKHRNYYIAAGFRF